MLENGLHGDDVLPERVFVLPAAKGQSWSLRKLATVFDSLPDDNDEDPATGKDDGGGGNDTDIAVAAKLAGYYERRDKARLTKEWGGKRLLLAMIDRSMGSDGTIVYYVVQEGIVKPRQN
jgi:tRNA-splicing endonuclease subunit Sen15, fungi type